MHAFAPVLIAVLLLLAAGLALRGRAKSFLRGAVKKFEEGTGVSRILLLGLVIYWLLRFLLDASQRQLVVH